MAKFGFTDLHSFKDYVGFAKLCLPDRFPPREGVSASDQWSLDLAFDGLRFGLSMAIQEKGDLGEFAESGRLIDEAYAAYKSGDIRSGFIKLEQVQKLLGKVPSE